MVICEIIFDNNTDGVYYSGQTLSGVAKLMVEKVHKIKGITLKIEGYAKCSWSEVYGSGNHIISITYSGRESYLQNTSYLIGSDRGNEIELQPGDYTYNFSCELPSTLPTSLEGSDGCIRYRTKVTIERSWKSDLSFVNEFTVIKPLDLNYEVPNLNAPFTMETEKKFWFTFSGKNSLQMSASVPVSGFVAGQNVNIIAEINNQTNIDIVYLKISLKSIIKYHSTFPYKSKKKEIKTEHEIRCNGIQKQEVKKFDENFKIPAVPPTNIYSSAIVKVSYEIQIKAKVGGAHMSPVLKLPIVVGTVPLYNFQAMEQMRMFPSFGDTADSYERDEAGNFILPPPTYEESQQNESKQYQEEEENKDSITKKEKFKPRYPVFNFDSIGFNDPHPLNSNSDNVANEPVQSDIKTPL